MPGGNASIELRRASRSFVTPTGATVAAIRDVDLTVAAGEFCALVGPTGCGKSTTLSLISGLAGTRSAILIEHGRSNRYTNPA